MLRDCRLLRIFEGSTEALQSHVGHSVWQNFDVFKTFVSTHFKVSTRLLEEFQYQVAEAKKVATGDKESGKALYVGLGEAFSYFLLEVALEHKLNDQPNVELSEFGIRTIRSERYRVMSNLVSNLDAPWVKGDIQSLRNLQKSVNASIGDHVIPHLKDYTHTDDIDVPNGATKKFKDHPMTPEVRPYFGRVGANFEAISVWMADWLSTRSFSNNDLAASTSFAELGLDSIDAVELLSDYSDYFVHEVDPTVLWQYPTQEKLCAFLSEGLAKEIDARTEPRRQEENSAHVIECSLIDRLERELNEI
jgi:acyl carrier protein